MLHQTYQLYSSRKMTLDLHSNFDPFAGDTESVQLVNTLETNVRARIREDTTRHTVRIWVDCVPAGRLGSSAPVTACCLTGLQETC